MSATMTAPEQVDGLQKLLVLASLKKEDIAASAEEARKQMQLTQEEVGRIAEARSYISQHATLAADIKRREDELLAAKAEHDKSVSAFSVHVSAENTRLENFSASLAVRENQLSDSEKRHAAERQALIDSQVTQGNQRKQEMNAIAAASAENTKAAQANAEEKNRLEEWNNKLKERAARIREQAASFQ